MKYTLSVLVENHPGVLSKVSGLFSRRGFNIDSLAVGITEDPAISRMTIVVDGDAVSYTHLPAAGEPRPPSPTSRWIGWCPTIWRS